MYCGPRSDSSPPLHQSARGKSGDARCEGVSVPVALHEAGIRERGFQPAQDLRRSKGRRTVAGALGSRRHADLARDPARGASSTVRRAARGNRERRRLGDRALRSVLRPLLRGLRVRPDRAPDRLRPRRGRHARPRRSSARGRARRGQVDARPRGALPRVPGRPEAGDGSRGDAGRPRVGGDDRRGPGRLPVDPRLPRADAQRALRRDCDPRRRTDRGADGDQVRGRGRAHPRERALGEPGAPAPPALHAGRRDRDGGLPAREQRGDVRDARCDRRDLSGTELRRDGRRRRVSRPDRA